MLRELLAQHRGQKPLAPNSENGLEKLGGTLQHHFNQFAFRTSDGRAQAINSAQVILAGLKPDFSLLLKMFPTLALMLLAVACTVTPTNGQMPEEPTPVVMPLPTETLATATTTSRSAVVVTSTPTRTTAATVTSTAIKTPTPTSSPSPEQATAVEQLASQITCTDTVIRRQGPGTSFSQVGTCAAGETIDLARVEGKTTSGGYTWLKVGDYYIALVSGRMTYDQQGIDALRTLSASELPQQAPTPVA